MLKFITGGWLLTFIVWLGMLVDMVDAGSSNPLTTPIDPWYFGSHYFKLSSQQVFNVATFNGAKPIQNYQISLGKVYNNIKQHNIIMSSFKCQNAYNFGIKLAVQIVGNPTSKVNITIEQLNSTIFSKIGVSVIIVAQPFNKVMTILEYDMDIQGQNYTKDFNYPSDRKVGLYIKSMNIKSRNAGYYFQLKFNIYSITGNKVLVNYNSIPDKSPTYDHKIQLVVIFLDNAEKNNILQFNFLFYDRYVRWNPAFGSSTVGIDTTKFGTDFNKKCIFGLYQIYSFNYNKPRYLFDLDPSVGLINTEQNSLYNYIGIQSFCFRDLECPDGFQLRKLNDYSKCYNCDDGQSTTLDYIPNCNIDGYDTSVKKISYSPSGEITGYCLKCINCQNHYYAQKAVCQLCSVHFPYCKLCDEKNKCLQCFPIALPNVNSTCILCQTFIQNCLQCITTTTCLVCKDGFFLQGGKCKKCPLAIDGCTKCTSSTNCLLCNPPLKAVEHGPGNVSCQCEIGWRVTSTCTQIYGCISSHKVNDTVLCYACNSTANFMYVQGHNCICKTGYYFNNKTNTCNFQCGDGIYVQSQNCDDGNSDRGDGCDASCNPEPNFICQNIRHKSSKCRLNFALNATVYSLSRKFGSNSLTLKLKYQPYHEFIQFNTWPNNVIVNSSKISFVSHEFENDLLVLHYSIAESIEFDTLDWKLSYDSDKFLTQSQSIPILMKGQNAPLTLQKYYKQQFILYIISYVLGGLSLVIGIVAMVKAQSNIAFQLCTTVLFIFYARVLTYEYNPAILYTLGGLRTASGWNDFILDQHTEYLQLVAKNRFYIKSQLSLGIIITLSILILLLTIKIVLQLKHLYEQIFDTKSLQKQQQLQPQNKQEQQSIVREYLKLLALDYDALQKKFTTPIVLISMFTVFAVFSARQIVGLKYDSHLPPIISNLVRSLFFLIIIYYAGMIGCILGTFYESLEVQQPKKRKINTQFKFKNYINTYSDLKYLYLIVMAMLMLFSIDYKREKAVFEQMLEVCLGIVIIYTITIIIMRPYTDKLNQFAIISHQIIKILFLVFLFLLKKSILTQLLQLIGVYLFLSLILLIEILSIFRIKKSWIPFKTSQEIKIQQKMKKNGIKGQDSLQQEQEQLKKKKKKYKKDDDLNPYRYEYMIKKQKQEQGNMQGFMKDYKKKQQKDKQLNMLQLALQKGNLTSLLLGNTDNQSNLASSTDLSSKKQLQQTNFIDEQITRRQRAQQLRKVKQKMRKQTQINNGNVIFENGNGENRNPSNLGSPQKKWRPLTHEQELQKKYEYDAWREKNLQRAMWEQEQQMRKKMQNKKSYGRKYA